MSGHQAKSRGPCSELFWVSVPVEKMMHVLARWGDRNSDSLVGDSLRHLLLAKVLAGLIGC